MKLYFTGANNFEKVQNSSLLSLGGYPSSSQLPALGIDKIFGSISQKDLKNGNVSTRAVVLKNITGEEVSAAKIYYENKSQFPVVSYKMALVQLSTDGCNNPVMESISSAFDKPLGAIFVDNITEDNALNFPAIPDGSYIGIWIERSVNKLKGNESLSCDFLAQTINTNPVNNVLQITIESTDILNQYFTIDTLQNKYLIWFNDGVQQPPSIATSYELLMINITNTETTTTIANKVNSKLQSIPQSRGEVFSLATTNSISVSNQTPGKVPESIVSSPNIAITTITSGIGITQEQIEDCELIIKY